MKDLSRRCQVNPVPMEAFRRDPAPGVKRHAITRAMLMTGRWLLWIQLGPLLRERGGVCRFTGERRVAFGAKEDGYIGL